MDTKREILDLSANALAFGTLLSFVLDRIGRTDPKLADAILLGFDDAASFLENFAFKTQKTASPEHTVKALQIVEEIRAATLRDHHKPRRSV